MCPIEVKSTFLNGPLDEDVYVKHPLGFEVKGQIDGVQGDKSILWIEANA